MFAVGFVLGTARTLFVADMPGGGRLLGVMIELPIMLAASWLVCRSIVRRLRIAPVALARITMGGWAFALLIAAEMLVGVWLFKRSPGAHFRLYQEPS